MVKLKVLLERLKSTPLDLRQLEQVLPESCKAMQYKDLKGKNRRELFKDTEGIVLLIPSKKSKIGHFVGILVRRNHIAYFSSLGNSPTKEATLLHTDEGIMKQILGSNFVYNRKRFQGSNEFKIRTCAMWCVARLYLSDLKLREFQELFSRSLSLSTADDIVSLLCLLPFSEI